MPGRRAGCGRVTDRQASLGCLRNTQTHRLALSLSFLGPQAPLVFPFCLLQQKVGALWTRAGTRAKMVPPFCTEQHRWTPII